MMHSPQNREQETFWVKWVFGIIVRAALSTLIRYQNQFILLLLFEMWPFVYKTLSSFSGSVILRNRPLKFLFRIVLIWQFAENAPFFWRKMFERKSVRNYMEVMKIIQVFKKKSQNRQMSYFLPYANFNCPYLKIGLCNLFPVLLECITYVTWSRGMSHMS